MNCVRGKCVIFLTSTKGYELGQQPNPAVKSEKGAFENIDKVLLDNPSWIRRIYGVFFKKSDLDTLEKLKTYLERSAAYLTYKNVQEYSRSRAGVHWNMLLDDGEFQIALEKSQWITFAISAELVGEMVLIVLRQKTQTDPQDLAGTLGVILKQILEEHSRLSSGLSVEWINSTNSILQKMRTGALVPPKLVSDIATAHVPKIFASLPVHKRIPGYDELLLLNGLHLNLLQLQHEFTIKANYKALAKAALASQSRSPDPDL
ncbi:hypothetical protein [Pseudovibrio sp. Tun.PSC04-5.I4]|uniref:hypothetical protein n=1 Tax=Pseudovibrio sp. Tun.PSC04-5.I4 TaxID=1798213 RepID=UPI000889190C|nr:hypothetical protein [Pseudovibrio sp. Tun.PSC04-5.I4]SDQ84607.1 hypothetical protein SAMN04515695_1623 [Pseudovibrio sp. Tun.PSC04-5.I4]